VSGFESGAKRFEERTFTGEDLEGLVLTEAVFTDCRFSRCRLAGACVFAGCDLGLLRVTDSRFTGVRLAECKAIGIDWTVAEWPLAWSGEPLAFQDCDLGQCAFLGLSLPGLEVIDCLAREADFREARLRGAKFGGTDLDGALFTGADLSEADFRGARNYRIRPLDCTVEGARFALPEALRLLAELGVELE
jgi:uncharacterized protein YjbI with pentapeptide repeats